MRLLAVVALVVGISSAAYAQPGPDAQPTPPVQSQPAPVAIAPPPGIMANRWAIDVGLGLQSLNNSVQAIGFVSYELGVRFRIIRPLEVALTFAAGANHADEYSALWIDARYNFMAEQPWNIYALLGFGGGSASAKVATNGDVHGRGTLRLGAGVERRFDVFSISAEVRLLTFGRNDQAEQGAGPTPDAALAAESTTGVGFVLGSTYYF
jgi:hypothetical protein